MEFEYFDDGTGLRIGYALNGPVDAPLIVFSNALGTNMSIWKNVRTELGTRFQTLVYDQRGQGVSSDVEGDWGMADHVADLAALMMHLGLSSAMICGLSIGGQIAQGLAAERPDLVAQLALVATSTKSGVPDQWAARANVARETGMEALLDAVMERWFEPAFLRDTERSDPIRKMVLANNPEGYAKSCLALGHTDLFDSTARLTVPSIAVAGLRDKAVPTDIVRELSEIMLDCEFRMIRGAGHIVPFDKPAELAAILISFAAVVKPAPVDAPPRIR